jgi:flavin reductase (DIM6/NTAB) family NADH-FMN oxidoreductase RutF
MGSHDVFFADILRVTADEELFDEAGKLHIERADLLAYAHGDYYRLGKCVGSFGFSAKKKGGARQRRERRK